MQNGFGVLIPRPRWLLIGLALSLGAPFLILGGYLTLGEQVKALYGSHRGERDHVLHIVFVAIRPFNVQQSNTAEKHCNYRLKYLPGEVA